MRRALVAGAVVLFGVGLALGQWKDGFDTYTVGPLVPQGGWELWYTGGNDGFVDNTQANSPPNSLRDMTGSDMVHQFNISGGRWQFRIKVYIPSASSPEFDVHDAYVILMSAYGGSTIDSWRLQVRFGYDFATGGWVVENQFELDRVPLVRDQWGELRAEIDLDLDTLDVYWNNQRINVTSPLSWTAHMNGGGTLTIAALDLYSQTMDNYFYDDVSLMLSGDVNCDGVVNAFDIDPFILALTDVPGYGTRFPNCLYLNADCNGDGLVNAFDIDPFIALLTG